MRKPASAFLGEETARVAFDVDQPAGHHELLVRFRNTSLVMRLVPFSSLGWGSKRSARPRPPPLRQRNSGRTQSWCGGRPRCRAPPRSRSWPPPKRWPLMSTMKLRSGWRRETGVFALATPEFQRDRAVIAEDRLRPLARFRVAPSMDFRSGSKTWESGVLLPLGSLSLPMAGKLQRMSGASTFDRPPAPHVLFAISTGAWGTPRGPGHSSSRPESSGRG